MEEIDDHNKPYRCHFIVALPEELKADESWMEMRDDIEEKISDFWTSFSPGIICDEVEVLATDEITLADIHYHLRFDVDWLSYSESEMPVTPNVLDLL